MHRISHASDPACICLVSCTVSAPAQRCATCIALARRCCWLVGTSILWMVGHLFFLSSLVAPRAVWTRRPPTRNPPHHLCPPTHGSFSSRSHEWDKWSDVLPFGVARHALRFAMSGTTFCDAGRRSRLPSPPLPPTVTLPSPTLLATHFPGVWVLDGPATDGANLVNLSLHTDIQVPADRRPRAYWPGRSHSQAHFAISTHAAPALARAGAPMPFVCVRNACRRFGCLGYALAYLGRAGYVARSAGRLTWREAYRCSHLRA